MTVADSHHTPRRTTPARALAGYLALMLAAWTTVWYVHEATTLRELGRGATFVFWTSAKLVVWIAPLLLITTRVLGQPARGYLRLTRPGEGVRVGCVIGVLLIGIVGLVDLAVGRSLAPPTPGWGTLNALLVAPLLEEIVCRGFALRALEDAGYRDRFANVLATMVFLALHLPGWFFMNTPAAAQVAAVPGIVAVGLAAGYATQRAESTWAAVTVHLLNNVYSACVYTPAG